MKQSNDKELMRENKAFIAECKQRLLFPYLTKFLARLTFRSDIQVCQIAKSVLDDREYPKPSKFKCLQLFHH